MATEHTLLPWRNESGILHAKYPNPTDTVHPARCDNEADAEFVELAVNNFYPMKAALKALDTEYTRYLELLEQTLLGLDAAEKWLNSARHHNAANTIRAGASAVRKAIQEAEKK